MSTPRLISPLLDNFLMGEPIYDKFGVRLCPAMEEGKDDKYIVKIISIPANQSQVDALLITGAYKDADSVNKYFAELADAVVEEASILSKLSSSGGFDCFKGMQIVPMDDGNGFDVYLLAPYRPTWDRLSQQKPVTQLDGYNLALDLCAALSVARRNGYLYVNLRPESISSSPSGYHICDLGLIGLNYLQYSSLPTGYFSAYTAPEVADAFSSLNSTMDVYALGMLLYEVFNCGLPFNADRAAAEEYPAPAHAEEEFGQIILKAIHPDPASRWQDPTQMGQAIVSVMQRKGVSDAVILPVVEATEEEPQEPVIEEDVLALADEFLEQASADNPEPVVEPVDNPTEEPEEEPEVAAIAVEPPAVEDAVANEQPIEVPVAEEAAVEAAPAEESPVIVAAVPEEIPLEIPVEEPPAPIEVVAETPSAPAEPEEIAEPEESAISDNITIPEIPNTTDAIDPQNADDDSLDNILLEADKLIADLQLDQSGIPAKEEYEQLTFDEPAAEPEGIIEAAEEPEANEVTEDPSNEAPEEEAPEEEAPEEEEPEEEKPVVVVSPLPTDIEEEIAEAKPKKSGKGKLIIIAASILLALMLAVGLFLYRYVYIQQIDSLAVSGTADTISVSVITNVDSNKLTVVCTDENGKTVEAKLVDYKATVTGLAADTNYTVTLKIDGIHKLIGETKYAYTTAEKTVISDFQVLNGTVEGTAEVSYALTGPNAGDWFATFKTQGEDDLTIALENGKTTVVGLTSGTTYSVTLSNDGDLYLDGTLETTFTPGPVIEAKDPYVSSCTNGKLVVNWTADVASSWIVRCYNENGFDETVTVSETKAEFAVPNDRDAYTVEISAAGQAATQTLNVTENAVNLFDFEIDTSVAGVITLNWSSSSDVPAGGYVVTYKVDGFEATISAEGNSLTLADAVPNATYTFMFAGANGQSVLCAPVTATASGGSAYSGHGIKANNLRYNLCVRPNKTNWTQSDVSSAYTTTFRIGQKASIVGRIITRYFTSDEMITTLYVFRDSNGKVAHLCSVEESWGDMWYNGYGYFDIPSLPETAGGYTMEIYYDGALAYDTEISIN